MICEATLDYICNFKIYSSAGKKLQDTILSILHPFVGLYHHIYMDNYYHSVDTAELLLQKNTRICGTIKLHRRFPHSLKNTKLREHETKFARKGQVLL